MTAVEANVRQRWGAIIAEWMLKNQRPLERLLERKDILIQITIPPDTPFKSAPQTALVKTPDGDSLTAHIVSPSPRTDQRIQGMGLFYAAPAQPDLPSGMNVIACLPVGSEYQGVFVPDSAIVWQHGKAWVYVQRGDNQFVRLQISTETPVKNGWFIPNGLDTGDKIVTKGAQLLLSEESRSQIQIGD